MRGVTNENIFVMNRMLLTIVNILLLFHFCNGLKGSIEDKLAYYETLDHIEVHSISKRSVPVQGLPLASKHVKFSALGRNFSLNLNIAEGLFSKDFKIDLVHEDGSVSKEDIDTTKFYYGTLDGEENSEVHAFLHDGVISATISIPGESFIIEPAWRHINSLVRESRTMMIYRGSDTKWPKEYEEAKSGNGPAFCGAAHIDDNSTETTESSHNHDEDEHDSTNNTPHSRKKRATTNKVCRLMAVADYKFYQSIAGNNKYDAANYIVGTIQKVNLIYKNTQFGSVTGYGMELAGLRLHEGPTAVTPGTTHYNMIKNWGSAYDLLQEFSYDSAWSTYCLAHLFTHQSFANNVLGLAYIASSSTSKLGGICSPKSTRNGKDIYYKTGLTTTKYTSGGTVLNKQSTLVTAHEIGHNWGSEHDPQSGSCAPSSVIGNGKYLMYPFSVTGEDRNNDDLSACSRNYISPVLSNKASYCFTEDTSNAPCGNGRIDAGEECDGGYLGRFDLDTCCDPTCKLKTNAACSPANHACCTDSCQVASQGTVCSFDLPELCTGQAVCNGVSLDCPQASFKAAGTSCLDGGQCDGAGTCKAFCEARSLESCMCGSVADSCRRCCKNPSATNPSCTAINSTVYHQDGRPCTVGYCDKGNCIKSDPSYINRFFDLIDQIDFDFVAEAFKTNMVAFIQVFSLIIWVPLSCFVWFRDRKGKKWFRNEENIEKRTNRNLMVDQDGRRIVRPVAKPRRDNPYVAMEPRSLTGRPYSSRAPTARSERPSSSNQVKPLRRKNKKKSENFINMSKDIDNESVA